MSCTITFIINNKPFIIEDVDEKFLSEEANVAPSTKATNEDKLIAKILQVAKDKNKYKELKNLIMSTLKEGGAESAISLETYQKMEGLVPNANINYLRMLYPEIFKDFPENLNIPILLVNRLGSQEDFGLLNSRMETTNGLEFYVIRNTRASVMRLALHLKAGVLIDGKSLVIDNFDEDLNSELDEIAKTLKTTKKELLKHYINHVSEYNDIKDIITSHGRTPKFVLEEALSIIRDTNGIPRYKKEHQLLNEFVRNIVFNTDKKYLKLGDFIQYCLKVGFLKNITTASDFISTFDKPAGKIKLDKWKPESDFETLFKEALINNLSKDEEVNGLPIFVETLFSLRSLDEPLFGYIATKPFKINNKYVLGLNNKFPSFESLFGDTYETIKKDVPVSHIGSWTIYSHKINDDVVYVPSRHVLTEKSRALTFPTKEEAENYARKLLTKETLREGAIGNLKMLDKDGYEGRTFTSTIYYPTGTIIKSLNTVLDFNEFRSDEWLLLDQKIDAFREYIRSFNLEHESEILDLLDSPEKAVAFLGILNSKNLERNDVNMYEAAKEVDGLSYKYYYIRKTTGTKKADEYAHYFLPVSLATLEDKTYSPRMPIILVLDQVVKMMKDKFNVEVEVLTLTEINQRLDDKKDPLYKQEINLGTKAFILNGVIYINSTEASSEDLFHEYGHLFMGVIKTKNPEWYMQTLDTLLRIDKKAQDLLEKKMKTLGRSYYDAAEEVFADRYGDWLMDNLPVTVSNLFNDKVIKETAHSIFDLKDPDVSIQELLSKKTARQLFISFNSNVLIALKNNNKFLLEDNLKLQRKKLNWLEKQLKLYRDQKEAGKSDEENDGIKEEC